jgi:hypothetical protein
MYLPQRNVHLLAHKPHPRVLVSLALVPNNLLLSLTGLQLHLINGNETRFRPGTKYPIHNQQLIFILHEMHFSYMMVHNPHIRLHIKDPADLKSGLHLVFPQLGMQNQLLVP